MDPYKAPGLDRFGPSFFQHHWPIIGEKIVCVIKDFFNSGRLLKEIDHTLIALIPKASNPERINQFRPISLYNVIYKIIAKVMVDRMRPILEKIIQPTQVAFIPQRVIHDNVLLVHELMNKFKHMKGKKAYVALRLDKRKPTIEWNEISSASVFKKWGFIIDGFLGYMNASLQFLILLLLTTKLVGFFKPSRGLSQGDPLSPYLFIICMDVLAQRLSAASQLWSSGIGVKVTLSAERIPYLLFANDILLFCKATIMLSKL